MSMMFGGETCNWCDKPHYECTCGKGLTITPREIILIDGIGEGDIICRGLTRRGKAIDEAFVHSTDGNKLIVSYLDGRNDGATSIWKGKAVKICNAIPI